MLLIAGNGRNVGKTTLACKIISHLSKLSEVIGLKISPHFHSYSNEEVVLESNKFVILEDRKNTSKDSSLMLQAGARRVFYVMVKQEHLEEALVQLILLLPDTAIVCESGGLHEFVLPGLFLFVNFTDRDIIKKHLLAYQPKMVINNGKSFDLNIENITYTNKQITWKDE